MQTSLTGPANNSYYLIDILFPVIKQMCKSEGLSDEMVGLMFFDQCFWEGIVIGRVESLFGSLDFVGEREVYFNRDDIDLPDEIFASE